MNNKPSLSELDRLHADAMIGDTAAQIPFLVHVRFSWSAISAALKAAREVSGRFDGLAVCGITTRGEVLGDSAPELQVLKSAMEEIAP